jgi:hypothetical protein
VSSNVPVAQATMHEGVLLERVQEALGQLVGVAKVGLLALSVGVALGVLSELVEEEVDDVVGPRSKHNPDRVAVRHDHEDGEVTLGGRHVEVKRPRVRTADGESEVQLATYEYFADRDPLGRVIAPRACRRSRMNTTIRLVIADSSLPPASGRSGRSPRPTVAHLPPRPSLLAAGLTGADCLLCA